MNIQTGLSFLSILVGSGAVGYVIRLLIRIEVLERLFEEKKEAMDSISKEQRTFETRISLVEAAVTDIRDIMEDVKNSNRRLSEIGSMVSQIADSIKGFVPRAEIEYHWKAYDNNVQRTEEMLKKFSDKFDNFVSRK